MNRINELRTERGILLIDLAEKVGIGVGLMLDIIKGECLPNKEGLESLERSLQADRLEIYDHDDLDLLGEKEPSAGGTKRQEKRKPSVRKCYRVSPLFASSIPDDVLEVCGYPNWQAWHYAALKKLLGEYAARKKCMRKEGA